MIPLRFYLLIFIAILNNGCFDIAGMCGNTIQQEIISPDGKNKLVKFNRDCGATTSNSTQISVLEANDELKNTTGNIFVSDWDSVEMKWLSKVDILIRHRDSLRFFIKEENVHGITIHYETLIIPSIVIDSSQRIEIKSAIKKVNILHGDWIESDFIFKYGTTKIFISEAKGIAKIISVISSSKVTENEEIHTNWLHINLSGEDEEISLVLVKTASGKLYFLHEKSWYEGDNLLKAIKNMQSR